MNSTLSLAFYLPMVQHSGGIVIPDVLAGNLGRWSHTIQADGGYWEAQADIEGGLAVAEDWLAAGLGRHVECYSGAQIIWEGFVNRVSARFGAVSAEVGPLMDITNRVRVYYRTLSINVTPPIPSYPAKTALADDDDSQAKYGVLEAHLGAGETTATAAALHRDLYLAEHKSSRPTHDLSLPAGAGPVSVQLELLGYVHLLKRYAYNQTATGGTVTIPDKIADILAANPNAAIFSANYSLFDSNATVVPQIENENRPALEIINDHVSLGDANNSRYIFGIYAGRTARYQAVSASGNPTNITYYHLLREGVSAITDAGDATVPPWEIQAGKWIETPDLFAGQREIGDIRLSAKTQFIESVRFATPNSLEINGQRIYRLPQFLARLGLGGM